MPRPGRRGRRSRVRRRFASEFMPQGSRASRVGDQIRDELAELLAREVHDPGIGFLTLTRVKVSPDLQQARVLLHDARRRKARKETAQGAGARDAVPAPADRPAAAAPARARAHFIFDESIEKQRSHRADPPGAQQRTEAEPSLPEPGKDDRDATTPAPMSSDRACRRSRRGRCRSSDEICDEILRRQRFLLTSHARPDGDSIGSQLAMAYALEALGKQVRIVNADAAPEHYLEFPGDRAHRDRASAGDRPTPTRVIVMECSDLAAPACSGLDGHFIINIDHHAGQPHVRRAQLARRVGRGLRRDGVRPDSRRSACR